MNKEDVANIILTVREFLNKLENEYTTVEEPPFKVGDYVELSGNYALEDEFEIGKLIEDSNGKLKILDHNNTKWDFHEEHYKHLKIDNVEQFVKDYVEKYDSDFVADWDDIDQSRYYIFFDSFNRKFMKANSKSNNLIGITYMSEQCAEKLVDILNKVVEI